RRPAYRIFSEPSVDPRLIRATLILSAPQFVFLVLMVVPEPLTIVFLAHLGPTSVAAFRALTIVSDLTWAMPGSIGSAAEIILGQRLGSRDIPGARSFQRAARRSAVMLCGSVAAVGAALAWPLAALVTWSTTLASIAAAPLALHMLTLPLKGYAMTTLAPIRAAGDTRFTMWIGILTSLIVVSLTYIGIVRANFGLWAVPIAWITAWTARSAITTWRLRQRDWERRELAA
ncbi:MAG: MATE family efflux transporter, partial [Vulcanimicrobiaceae bacterium]